MAPRPYRNSFPLLPGQIKPSPAAPGNGLGPASSLGATPTPRPMTSPVRARGRENASRAMALAGSEMASPLPGQVGRGDRKMFTWVGLPCRIQGFAPAVSRGERP
jgi:hypothetical protein